MTDELQLALSREALRRASTIIAEQADLLARELDAGRLEDRGGGDALRLFAAIVRLNGDVPEWVAAGRA